MAKRIFFIMIALAVILSAFPAPALAQTDLGNRKGSYVEFVYNRTYSKGGIQWIEDGELHIRNRTDFGTIKGMINGVAELNFNCDMDLKTGNGQEYGTMTIYESRIGLPDQAIWVGEWTHVLEGGLDVDGEMVAEGYGANEGRRMVITKVYSDPSEDPMGEVHIGYIQWIP